MGCRTATRRCLLHSAIVAVTLGCLSVSSFYFLQVSLNLPVAPIPETSALPTRTVYSNTTMLPNRNEDEIHWCVITKRGMRIIAREMYHFPHVFQALAPCWSWLVENNAQDRCGLVFDHFTSRRALDRPTYRWHLDLIHRVLECQIKTISHDNVTQHMVDTKLVTNTSRIFLPTHRGQFDHPNSTWFRKVQHATALRNRVLDKYNSSLEIRDPALQPGRPISIGFITRNDARRVSTLDQAANHLQRTARRVHVTDLDGYHLGQQAEWFASHDVIVAAHGAALTNAAFLMKQARVIELYPRNYFPVQFYKRLIEQAGGIHYVYYDGNRSTAEKDWEAIQSKRTERFEARTRPIQVTVETIVSMVETALGEVSD